ncbi:hypothetical protein BKA70DRAFT_1227599 [Coprinopsis sp. MPI-PUGE-AT-0042]|nr:hypothetical protein BKA70DRAFT_1227599 [Coprinopsis sp. MPI-PUGE-AT-0042]
MFPRINAEENGWSDEEIEDLLRKGPGQSWSTEALYDWSASEKPGLEYPATYSPVLSFLPGGRSGIRQEYKLSGVQRMLRWIRKKGKTLDENEVNLDRDYRNIGGNYYAYGPGPAQYPAVTIIRNTSYSSREYSTDEDARSRISSESVSDLLERSEKTLWNPPPLTRFRGKRFDKNGFSSTSTQAYDDPLYLQCVEPPTRQGGPSQIPPEDRDPSRPSSYTAVSASYLMQGTLLGPSRESPTSSSSRRQKREPAQACPAWSEESPPPSFMPSPPTWSQCTLSSRGLSQSPWRFGHGRPAAVPPQSIVSPPASMLVPSPPGMASPEGGGWYRGYEESLGASFQSSHPSLMRKRRTDRDFH